MRISNSARVPAKSTNSTPRIKSFCTSPPIGINWASNFVKRHSEIQTRYNRQISYKRAKQENPNIIISWLDTVQAAIQEYGIHEDDIWNFDETSFAMGLCSTSKVITLVECSERPRTVI